MFKSLLEVRGIGPSSATILTENGIATAEDLAVRQVKQVAAINGFSEIRAGQVIANAKALVASGETKLIKEAKPTTSPVTKKKVAKKHVKKKLKEKKKAAKIDKADKKAKKAVKGSKKSKKSAKKSKK